LICSGFHVGINELAEVSFPQDDKQIEKLPSRSPLGYMYMQPLNEWLKGTALNLPCNILYWYMPLLPFQKPPVDMGCYAPGGGAPVAMVLALLELKVRVEADPHGVQDWDPADAAGLACGALT
ncbi:hypothetical protein ACJX0J_014358, partial [Zea mays]